MLAVGFFIDSLYQVEGFVFLNSSLVESSDHKFVLDFVRYFFCLSGDDHAFYSSVSGGSVD